MTFSLLLLVSPSVSAQIAGESGGTSPVTPEQRTARELEIVRQDPLALRAFLVRMPKGADLHSHLMGAVYAESLIRAATDDNLCVDPESKSFTKRQTVTGAGPQFECGEDAIPAADIRKNQNLYDALIDTFSMRGFVPSSASSEHDHFFNAFMKFGGTDPRHEDEWVDEVATRAAEQNEQYLELMVTPTWNRLNFITKNVSWNDDLNKLREELLAKGLRDDVPAAQRSYDQAEASRRQREHCGEPGEVPACKVQTRYIYQVYRNNPKELVFAQALLGCEIASSDPRVVAINFVQAEDDYTSMSDYALQMRMVGFLHEIYPQVHITLHAGELAPGMVPPNGLCCHIRLAIEQAHAERIGHGVDIMYEDRPEELLREMAAKHLLVEVNLTSNDFILRISGKDHPFLIYRQYGVPVALSTDDEGVSRIDLTHEFVRAVETYDLHYGDLKQMVRNSLEHSFLPGASLWQDRDIFTRVVSDCQSDAPTADSPSTSCVGFLNSSEKAQQQWELERRFHVFEATH